MKGYYNRKHPVIAGGLCKPIDYGKTREGKCEVCKTDKTRCKCVVCQCQQKLMRTAEKMEVHNKECGQFQEGGGWRVQNPVRWKEYEVKMEEHRKRHRDRDQVAKD
mmetsp:Transcript_54098/g.105877  ORF Transcript_54098/g.105877 Transcript_54098/m.105877 type:complete len:106 (+) Transcript_54098:127-444(+)